MTSRPAVLLVVLSTVAMLALPARAAAQTGAQKRLAVGFTFIIRSANAGGGAVIDLPVRTLSSGALSVFVGGSYVKGADSYKGAAGGGLKLTRKLNSRVDWFVEVVAGAVVHPAPFSGSTTDFGAAPGGGVVYHKNERLDVFVEVGVGVFRRQGFLEYSPQVTAGVSVPIGR